ncbi:hypothetical protein CR513_42595, partial [Mucuna pruriens]
RLISKWTYASGPNNHKVSHDGVNNRFSFVHRGQKDTLKPLSLKEVNEDQEGKEKTKGEKRKKNKGVKRKEDVASKGTVCPKDLWHLKDPEHPKIKNDKIKSEKGKVVFITSRRVVRKRASMIFSPMNIPRGLPPIRGIEHQIDFTMVTTLPNKATYKANPKESKEIQQ